MYTMIWEETGAKSGPSIGQHFCILGITFPFATAMPSNKFTKHALMHFLVFVVQRPPNLQDSCPKGCARKMMWRDLEAVNFGVAMKFRVPICSCTPPPKMAMERGREFVQVHPVYVLFILVWLIRTISPLEFPLRFGG